MLHVSMILTRIADKVKSEEGAGLAEYALLLTLIAVACVGALTGLGGAIQGALGNIAGNL